MAGEASTPRWTRRGGWPSRGPGTTTGTSSRQLIEIDFEEADGVTTDALHPTTCGTKRPSPPTRAAGHRVRQPRSRRGAVSRRLFSGKLGRHERIPFLFLVDVFADKPLTGNPLAVVADAASSGSGSP